MRAASLLCAAEKSQFVRAAFSTASPADMDQALARLAELLREQTGKK